jgi:hypothetical protein
MDGGIIVPRPLNDGLGRELKSVRRPLVTKIENTGYQGSSDCAPLQLVVQQIEKKLQKMGVTLPDGWLTNPKNVEQIQRPTSGATRLRKS